MEAAQQQLRENPVVLCLLISVLVIGTLVYVGACSCEPIIRQPEPVVHPELTPVGNGQTEESVPIAQEQIPIAPYVGTQATGFGRLGNLGMFAGVFVLMLVSGAIYIAYQRGLASAQQRSVSPLLARRSPSETLL